VFERDDGWVSTGDFFSCDEDGTLWLVNAASALVHTKDGPVAPSRVRTALESLDSVDVAVAYGIAGRESADEQVVAALSVREGHALSGRNISSALARLPRAERPVAVRITDRVPTTTWYRPRLDELRAAGLRAGGDRVLRADSARRSYRASTNTRRKDEGR
jgi:putative long chain acyl-CoA synthase